MTRVSTRFLRDPALGHGEASCPAHGPDGIPTIERCGIARPVPVAVLLSTFNGAEFVDGQIASILRQNWPEVRLLIRDDGSTDATWSRLGTWRSDPRVVALRGRNVGAKASFLQMLGLVEAGAEFVAFADQHDVWHREKIVRAMVALRALRAGAPALYCARGFVTDRGLNVTGMTPRWPRPPSFGNALVENIAPGPTIVLNPPAVALLMSAGIPSGAIRHDWWCYLVVSAFGTVIVDPRPSVLLRRSGPALAGSTTAAKCARHAGLAAILEQAYSFLAHFGDRALGAVERRLACDLVHGSFFERRAAVADGRLYRQFAPDDLRLRLRMLLAPWPRRPSVREPNGSSAARVAGL